MELVLHSMPKGEMTYPKDYSWLKVKWKDYFEDESIIRSETKQQDKEH